MRRLRLTHRPPRRREPRFTLGTGTTSTPSPRPSLPPLPWQRIKRLAMIGGGSLALALAAWWVWTGDALRVQTVIVVGGEVVDANAVAAAAALHDQPLLTLDAGAAEARIRAIPGVDDAIVRRDWPRSATIEIREKQGWGYWQAAGIRSLVDAEGRVLDKARPPSANAPTVYEAGGSPLHAGGQADRDTVTLVTRLLSDGTFERLGATPLRFEFDRARGLTVRLQGAPAAVFGDSHDYEFKVAAWVAILDRIRVEQIPAGEVDLRFGRELVVR